MGEQSSAAPASLADRHDPAVRVVAHDLAWAEAARAEMLRVKEALGAIALRIDHIGSTAVPGLAGKPVIDLMVGVCAMEPAARYVVPLERLGYLSPEDHLAHGRRFFGRPASWPRSHHLHVVPNASPEQRRHLAVRDYLRTHPKVVADYAAVKRELVAAAPEDRLAYLAGKDPYMAWLETQALKWADAVHLD